MAKISLRVYNREIEGLIEGGQLDEAIAHCQHILKSFSMHIETYQLLGKAYLEAHRYTDAADIFQRILNATPDDFIAHVGMSIIRDDEGKLDDAIWHMERAFEVQPSNPAIQGELRRLFGRRDGVEPPKIRLSRDALANMYAQGELYTQAIAEIRAILADEPERPDLQVMLARAYLKTGQKVEAAEMAAHLLRKYPYCRDALRILVDVLPGTGRAENTQVYRQRLRLLDPYSSFITGSVFTSDQAPDASVNLERLEYSVGAQSRSSQPTWAASLGVKLQDEKPEPAQPTWQVGAQPEPAAEPGQPGGHAPEGDGLPDFLRSAGWGEADGQAPVAAAGMEAAPDDQGIAKGEMPDWLKSQAPEDLGEPGKPADGSIQAGESDLPGWLAGIGLSPETPPAAEQPAAELPSTRIFPEAVQPNETESNPAAWLADLGAGVAEPPQGLEAMPDALPEASAEALPDWMVKAAEELPAPDIQAAAPEAPLPGIARLDTEEVLPSLPEIPAEGIPEAEFKAGEVEGFAPPPLTGTVKPLGIEDDTMAWLEGLAAKQGAKPEELLTKPEDRSEEMPDWLKKTAEESSAVDANLPASPVLPDMAGGSLEQEFPEAEKRGTVPLPDLPAYFNQTAPPAPQAVKPEAETMASGELEGMEWLDELAEDKPVQAVGTEMNLGEELDAMPDWLRGSNQQAAPVESLEDLAPPVDLPLEETYTLADAPEPPAEAGAVPTVEEDITITTWLKNLDGSNIPAEMPAAAPSSEPEEDVPDWLKDLDKSPASNVAAAPAGTGLPQEDLPEWLAKPSEPMADEPSPAAPLPGKEPVEWSVEDSEPVEKPAPTVSEEWMPVGQQPAAPTPQAPPQPVRREPVQESKVTVPPPPPGPDGAVKTEQAQDKDAQTLAAAQKLLSFNNLAEAMKEYGKLIKRGRLLDEVIHDLREAQYRFPVDIIVWQTLGDAYMRANRLQDALDAYTKAEELLR